MAKEPEIDWTKVEEAALALLSMTLHEDNRVWKGLSWDITDRLFERGPATGAGRFFSRYLL